jgi:hypothetical protein
MVKSQQIQTHLISLHSLTNEARVNMKKNNVDTVNYTNTTKISGTIHDSNNIKTL